MVGLTSCFFIFYYKTEFLHMKSQNHKPSCNTLTPSLSGRRLSAVLTIWTLCDLYSDALYAFYFGLYLSY